MQRIQTLSSCAAGAFVSQLWGGLQNARARAGNVPKESSVRSFVPTGLSNGGPAETYTTLLPAILAAHKAPGSCRIWTVQGGALMHIVYAFFPS